MMWGLNKKSNSKRLLISLNSSEVRLFHVEVLSDQVKLLDSTCADYSSVEELQGICKQWVQEAKLKGLSCDWLLSRSHYKTFTINTPNVPSTELGESIKWLVKDLLEQSLDQVLVSYYKPYIVENEAEKLVAVVVEREFTEALIEITEKLNLQLSSIQIDELASVSALTKLQQDQQITGLIDEDKNGLIYNFYVGRTLAFTRHIKNRFFPGQTADEFKLDDDEGAQTDQFLLETQRTLDYCVSQFFRKPVNRLTLDACKNKHINLVDSLEQITELPVDLVSLENQESSDQQNPAVSIKLSLSEAGALLGNADNSEQWLDFYLPQYRPKPLEFGFKYAVGLTAISILGMLVYGVAQESELTRLEGQLIEQKNTLEKTQLSLQSLSKSLGKQNVQQNYDQIINKKQMQLSASRKLLTRVETTSPAKAVVYSQVLAALAEQQAPSLWLTEIKLNTVSFDLSGQTTLPESIPTYIDSISKNKLLASHFENLTIERDKQDPRLVHFQMTNGHFNNAN